MKYKDILQNSIHSAAEWFAPALDKCIATVIAELQEFENKNTKVSERQIISAAWVELHQNAKMLAIQFNDDLLESLNLSVAVSAETIRTAKSDAMPSQRGAGITLSAFLPKIDNSKHGNLSLVDDADVSHAISSSRFLQQIGPRVEAQLEELNKLISAVQGLHTVRADLNPLRPEVFVQTFIKLISTVASEPRIGLLWINHFAKPMALEINALYGFIIDRLNKQSVQALQYKVIQASAPAGPSGAAVGAARGNPFAAAPNTTGNRADPTSSQGALLGHGEPSQQAQVYEDQGGQIESNQELLKNYIQGGNHQAHFQLPESYIAEQQAVLSELMAARASQPSLADYADNSSDSQYVQMPVVDRPLRQVDEQSQLNQKMWGEYGLANQRAIVRAQLKTQAKEVGQVLSLEMVRKLVNKVAQDPRLLNPVREAIVALEPSLMRLAMVDPRFFSEEDHPARRLMERVAQRSFKYNDEFSDQFNDFFGYITSTFNQLNNQAIDNALPFKDALAMLDAQWAEQDQQAALQQERALAALRFAEKRQSLAGEIAYEISHRPDLEGVPGLVLDFLFETWSLAMAHVRLLDGKNQIDPEGFNSVVFDLLWSVKRTQTIKQPSKLIRMIPGLLTKLNQGLDLIGKDRQDSQTFLDALMQLHQPVLNLRRAKTVNDAQQPEYAAIESSETEESDASPEQRLANLKDEPWLGKADAQAFGFENSFLDTQNEPVNDDAQVRSISQPASLAAALSAPVDNAAPATSKATQKRPAAPMAAQFAAPVEPADPQEGMKMLQVGGWVDLSSQGQWTRAQLIWVNDKSTLFMFSSHGGQPHSMTRRRCEHLMADKLLRPLLTQGVVERALSSVTAGLGYASQADELTAHY